MHFDNNVTGQENKQNSANIGAGNDSDGGFGIADDTASVLQPDNLWPHQSTGGAAAKGLVVAREVTDAPTAFELADETFPVIAGCGNNSGSMCKRPACASVLRQGDVQCLERDMERMRRCVTALTRSLDESHARQNAQSAQVLEQVRELTQAAERQRDWQSAQVRELAQAVEAERLAGQRLAALAAEVMARAGSIGSSSDGDDRRSAWP